MAIFLVTCLIASFFLGMLFGRTDERFWDGVAAFMVVFYIEGLVVTIYVIQHFLTKYW